MQGLDVLSRSIDQKSASLKVLVESNFERFVRAKATIDNVYMEMKNQGADSKPTQDRSHSRNVSRSSMGYRNSSAGNPVSASSMSGNKKNAMTKESEYGVLGIKGPLIEISAKAEEIWGPALGGREKEEGLKTVMTSVDRYKESFGVGSAIADSIKRKDHESLVEEYTRARRIADEAKRVADNVASTNRPPSDSQLHQILIAARMWHDVEAQIEDFKRDVWKRLIAMQGNGAKSGATSLQQAPHMELISILLELGVEDNPIWIWLLSRLDNLKSKIQSRTERSRVEIEVSRRRLANGQKPTPQIIAAHLRSVSRQSINHKASPLDSTDVIDLWERIYSFLNSVLSSQGILGEVMEFWHTVQGFIGGKTQKTLPVGLSGESRKHHRLSDQDTSQLQEGMIELVDMIRESISSFFSDPPIEDISLLFSPIPPSPRTPGSTLTPSSLRDPRFAFNAGNLPPPSPRRGEAWEKFAFWPPWSNSLSGVHYLARLLVVVGNGASEMASVSPVGHGDGAVLERLRSLVGGARERCVTAICAAWNKDAENVKVLEDWTRSTEKRDLTRMPNNFMAFESAVLSGMQKILYISEAMTKPGSAEVVLPPPAKLLQMVRSQFVTTLYKALSGMVENAEKSVVKTDDDWAETDGLASLTAATVATSIGAGTVNASDRVSTAPLLHMRVILTVQNVRMLMTLSNLQALRVEIVPNLTTQFENAFSVKLTDETKTIRDVLGQIDARLFQSYTRPAVENLHSIVQTGIMAVEWAPKAKPTEVNPYVYAALLSLVLVHTQVSTTASSLTSQVLSYLLEQTSRELLEAFKTRSRYSLTALMQATLDVEFVAQTLSQYTTDRASEIQSQIYQELDKATDNDARTKLQSELPEMRAVLKRLREGSRSEFACFKKARRGGERVVPEGQK